MARRAFRRYFTEEEAGEFVGAVAGASRDAPEPTSVERISRDPDDGTPLIKRSVGGDLAAQVEQAYLNVATALAPVGGSFADVAKLTIYVDWSKERCQR